MSNKMNSGINYTVNEAERTVAAYIPNGYLNVTREVMRKLYKVSPYLACCFEDNKDVRKILASKNMVMVAKCHPNDQWDTEKGMAIARAKLLVHESNIRLRLLAIAYNMIMDWLNEVDTAFDKEFDRNITLVFERDAHCGHEDTERF